MNRFKMTLLAIAGAFALMLGAGNLYAQTDSQFATMFSTPSGSFVTNPQGVSILANKVVELKNQLQALNPGTPAYTNLERAVNFYSTVQSEVESNQTIPASILKGIEYLAQNEVVQSTNTEIMALRTEAISLLKK